MHCKYRTNKTQPRIEHDQGPERTVHLIKESTDFIACNFDRNTNHNNEAYSQHPSKVP